MPNSRTVRPPAYWQVRPVLQPQFTQVFAPMGVGHDGARPQPGALGGGGFGYQTQYVVMVNPVKEPPKPIVVSLSQPVSVAGWRRTVRTYMGVPYLQRGSMGRVAHVGRMVGGRGERDKIRGSYSRGWTWKMPAPVTGPGQRVIGPAGTGGPRWVTRSNLGG